MAIACPDCGALQELPSLGDRGIAVCRLCDQPLERQAGRSVSRALATASASLLLFLVPISGALLMTVGLMGASRESTLASGPRILFEQHWVLLAVAIGCTTALFPLCRMSLLVVVLGSVQAGRKPSWLGPAFRWALRLSQWAMPDVFVGGLLVGYSRVTAQLSADIGAGGWCLLAAGLLAMITEASLDRRTVWRAISPERGLPPGPAISCTDCDLVFPHDEEGRPCPRCGAILRTRKVDSLIRTTALVLAGFILYGPANIYPMTSLFSVRGNQHHTIFSGIRELVDAHLWPLAVVIFCTSIAIPLLKLIGLSWLVVSVRLRVRHSAVGRTKLHRFIHEIGRWSFVDVFTVAVFSPLMQFGSLASVRAGRGCLAFMLVVVLTMFASHTFDPRLIWDAAEARQ